MGEATECVDMIDQRRVISQGDGHGMRVCVSNNLHCIPVSDCLSVYQGFVDTSTLIQNWFITRGFTDSAQVGHLVVNKMKRNHDMLYIVSWIVWALIPLSHSCFTTRQVHADTITC